MRQPSCQKPALLAEELVTVSTVMFVSKVPEGPGIVKPTPLLPSSSPNYNHTMFGSGQIGYTFGQQMDQQSSVLDLRVPKCEEPMMSSGPLTPPRDEQCKTPPMAVVSPTLAITQRVLAAAREPQGTRPFKAYPKDPLSLGTAQDEAYIKFREEMLTQVRGSKGGCHRRQPGSPTQQTHSGGESDEKDAAYWERRRKNNEAAKRSRDARRAKEDEIAIRAAFLEQENLKLKYQIAAITEEYNHMRRVFYESRHHHTLQPIM